MKKENDNNNNNDYIKVDLNEENIKKMESKIVNYNLHSLYYEKNSGRINDWVNPTFLEKNFKTK